VLAGLEVIRTLNDQNLETRRPLELICWTNEEGARFPPPMLASGVFAGVYELDWALARTDDDGLTFGDELKRIAMPATSPSATGRSMPISKLHIEQGDRSSMPRASRSASSPAAMPPAACMSTSSANAPMPARRRWTGARNALNRRLDAGVSVNEIGWKYHPTAGKATVRALVCWPNKAGIPRNTAQLHLRPCACRSGGCQPDAADARAVMTRGPRRAQVEMKVAGEWSFGSEKFDPDCVGPDPRRRPAALASRPRTS